MDKDRVRTFILVNRDYFLEEDIVFISSFLEHCEDRQWGLLSTLTFKDPQTALMLSIFGSVIGIDRIYIGDYLLGVFKTVTCGGLFVWAFIDQFLIKRAAKVNNRELLFKTLNGC